MANKFYQKQIMMTAWLQLIRAHSAFGAALAVWVGGRLAGAIWQAWWLIPMAVAFLLSAAGNAFNDAHDIEIDRINRPKRPIPSGLITPGQAHLVTCYCVLLALIFAIPFGILSTLGTVVGIILLFSYTTHLKSIPLLGNAVVGLLTGMAIGYGGLLEGNVEAILLPGVTFGLLFGGREVLKTIHDVSGDRANGLQTIATVSGNRIALFVATCCIILGLIFLMMWVIANPSGELILFLITGLSLCVLIPLWIAPYNQQVISWSLISSKAIGLSLLVILSM